MADRYWVGGTGTWNNNSGGRWSNVSGGGGGYGNPGPTDNAIFDGNSGGGNVNVATSRNCYNLLLNGFTGTFTGAQTTDLAIYGDTVTLTGSSGVSMPGNGPRLVFYSSYTVNINFYSYGSTIGNLLVNSNNKNFYLQQHATSKNNSQFISYGSVYLNGYDLTIGTFDNNSLSYLYMGSGVMQVIMAAPPNSMPVVFNQAGGTSVSAASGILRFTRARATGALSSAMNSSQTTLTLIDAYLDNNQTVWPSSGTIQIENEILSYTSISSGVKSVTLSGLTRGLYYSAPASHDQYKPVLLLGPYFTTLSSSIGSTDTTLYVTDNSQFPGNGYLEVGGEIVSFSGKSGTTAFTGVTRGQTTYGGTSAASHASGTTVRHMEGRQMSFYGGGTFGTVEFGNSGGYMLNLINQNPTFTLVRAGPYLPANPIGMTYLEFVNSPTITNFKLAGRRPIQGIIAQPVYVKGKTGTNTSTTIYGLSGYPGSSVLPYTYTGVSETDFFDFLNSAGPTFGLYGAAYGAAPNIIGCAAYTTAGNYTWVAPAGVSKISVVAVGGGGGGGSRSYLGCWYSQGNGGGGGGLGYKNNITVTPGSSYTVVVGGSGAGGVASSCYGSAGCSGGDSYFINSSTVKGGGGSGGIAYYPCCNTHPPQTNGGTYVGDGGGNGGKGGRGNKRNSVAAGGGGGAGGYSGAGGDGGCAFTCVSGTTPYGKAGAACSGAAGGGSAGKITACGYRVGGAGGGGVGILGKGSTGGQTLNPCSYSTGIAFGGNGGSGGCNADSVPLTDYLAPGTNGAKYGGGGGGAGIYEANGHAGAVGAVRIIYPGTF